MPGPKDHAVAARVLEALPQVAAGDAEQTRALARCLDQLAVPACALIELAVTHAGDARARAVCDRYLAEPAMAQRVPLHLQEYVTVLGDQRSINFDLAGALNSSAWMDGVHRAICAGEVVAQRCARQLLIDFDAIAAEAAELVPLFEAMRAQLTDELHFLKLQILRRAQLALGDLTGRSALVVGARGGALLGELRLRGAQVVGNDVVATPGRSDIIVGDFMHVALPGPFDLVAVSAVFEDGSGWQEESEWDAARSPLLERLRDLTAPGSVVAIENVGLPMAFDEAQAADVGFALERQLVYGTNHLAGGRGCTLRRIQHASRLQIPERRGC